MIVLEAVDLVKRYVGGDGVPLTVLDGVTLQVSRGEMVAVVGASGSGKSTLLHLLGALDRPTSGEVIIAGERIGPAAAQPGGRGSGARRERLTFVRGRSATTERDGEISKLRNRAVGFVFQFHHLLREFNAIENVMMPMWIGGWETGRAEERARGLLARVGVEARALHRPSELSGGEQQRVAVARALATEPAILLLDEPSGNLDHTNSERLHDLLGSLSRDLEIATVVVTHNRALAARADRILSMEDGKLHPSELEEPVR